MSCLAVLSIGSNVGDSVAAVRSVIEAARATGHLKAESSLYATPPWGPVEQDEFCNAVIVVDGFETPADWLEWAQAREAEGDRTRDVRWGPRTIDVDVVAAAVDGTCVQSDDPELTLPHPRAGQRAFVLVPWLEANPNAKLAGVPVEVLVGELDEADREGVRRLENA